MANRRKMIIAVTVLALPLLTGGCAPLPDVYTRITGTETAADRLVPTTHAAVDQLLDSLQPGADFSKNQPVIVATIVNIDDLKGSRLGRVLSEQIATCFTQKGHPAIELKLRDSIFVKQSEGEMLLSREVRDLTLKHNASAVVVGTYAEARDYVYVTIKIVNAANNQAIAAKDFALPMDSTVYSLLTAGMRN